MKEDARMYLRATSNLQYGAYPLIAPRNESFPEAYITRRHDLVYASFNQTSTNGTVQVNNPLTGDWFAMVCDRHPSFLF